MQSISIMKKATQFMIKKLSPIDRLSIIKYGTAAHKVCGLRVVDKTSQEEIINLVTQIKAEGWTNITDGLQTALKVLDGRIYKDGRSVGIMLMSDGEQNRGGDATQVEVGSVPVYTFGFGTATNARGDPKAMADVLSGIAKNSNGGTFSDLPKTDGLSVGFAQCLAGLLTLAVQDLKLVISPENKSRVDAVSAGDYGQSGNTPTEPAVTVAFGNLYDKEMRKIIVNLVLPKVDKEVSSQVLKISYKYMNANKTEELKSPTIFESIKCTGKSPPIQKEEVTVEASRILTAQKMKEARILADQKLFDAAKNKIVEAQNLLADVEIDGFNSLIEILKAELQQFLIFLQSPEIYKKSGRAYAMSAELSHERQRHSAEGDGEEEALAAKGKPVPTAAEDANEEAISDPIGPISGALSLQIQITIQALMSIQNILHSARKPVPTAAEDAKEEVLADPIGPISGALSLQIQVAIQALMSVQNILHSARKPVPTAAEDAKEEALVDLVGLISGALSLQIQISIQALMSIQNILHSARKPVPTAAEDAKEEALADPVSPISGALNLQFQIAIQALMSIQNILDSAAP